MLSGKSLPVHCIVEAVSSVDEPRMQTWKKKPIVETDSFVIIPVNTAFQELVHVALHRLGYPRDSASAAKGSVVIKNWKPLSFDKIAEGPHVTVGDILGELTTIATLRIQIYRARPTNLSEIKDKLLRFLLAQSQGLLLSTGCPLDQMSLSNNCSQTIVGSHVPEPTDESRRKFDQWWSVQYSQQHQQQQQSPTFGTPLHHSSSRSQPASQYSPGDSSHHSSTPNKLMERPPSLPENVHPALQKTRMRTSFDPQLQQWLGKGEKKTDNRIQQYVKELNGLESRRGRKPLDINNVVYWFKNARAAQKRAELRSVGPGIGCHLTLNGYNSSSHSPPHSGSMMLGQDSLSDNSNDAGGTSEQEDEDDHAEQRAPGSPTAPLSLTTNDKEHFADSPKSTNLPEMQSIKQEPPDETGSPVSSTNNNNNNNTTNNKDCESECTMHPARIGELNRQQERLRTFRSPSPSDMIVARGPAGFPLVPNSMFSHSIMYMSHYIPGLAHQQQVHPSLGHVPPPSSSGGLNLSALASADERRKRNRTFIDPVTEVPRLEHWFSQNTHPSHNLIMKYTQDLNSMAYRQKFPRLEPKNVQFWFKNRRAKCKRLKMSLYDTGSPSSAALPRKR
ncbi:hypothetical protein L9F63_016349, partial [Diploptera punctata]